MLLYLRRWALPCLLGATSLVIHGSALAQAKGGPAKPVLRPMKAPKGASKGGAGAKGASPAAAGTPSSKNAAPKGVMRAPDENDSQVLTQAERDYFLGRATPHLGAGNSVLRAGLTGVPVNPSPAPTAEGGADTSWLSRLELPDLPLRWDARVVRYLEFFKDDNRGKAMITSFARKSGRYGDAIRRTMRKKGLPEDLAWLAMIESGYDPVIHSRAGAAGLWQFMPETGKQYGLQQDRFMDQRYSPRAATEAACDYLSDLHRRFGSWELAMAAYDMGHGGLMGVVKRYNTNDYWALSQLEGSLPWETTLYVPKILAVAVAMRNPVVFGLRGITPEAAMDGDDVAVPSGLTLSAVAAAAGASVREIEQLNPELRLGMTPPNASSYVLRVPQGRGAAVQNAFAKELANRAANGISTASESDRTPTVVVPQEAFVYPERRRMFHRVQGGDTLRDIAERYHVTSDEIVKWNQVDPSAKLVDGMTLQLFVPMDLEPAKLSALLESEVKIVAVGSEDFIALYELKGRKRVVVKAKAGDTLNTIADQHHVSAGQLERINRRARTDKLAAGTDVVLYLGEAAPPPAPQVAQTNRGKHGSPQARSGRGAAPSALGAPTASPAAAAKTGDALPGLPQ